jgi:hypothetical protein
MFPLSPMSPIREREVFELKRLSAAIQVDKELLQKVAKQTGFNAIEIVLALAAVANQAGHAEKSQVVTDSWLSLIENAAQGGDVHFAFVRECQKNFKP